MKIIIMMIILISTVAVIIAVITVAAICIILEVCEETLPIQAGTFSAGDSLKD